MKTLFRRPGNIKGILKRPKKNLSNTSIISPPNVPLSVIPESWIWRLELGVIFASAALILFSGVMRSRMIHLEKICKDFISTKNINSILAKYEQSALNLAPMIDGQLKRMADDIGRGQNLSDFYDNLLLNITESFAQVNLTLDKIAYERSFINSSSSQNKRDCEDLQSYVTTHERDIDNLTLRITSLSSNYASILARMNALLNQVKSYAVPADFVYVQLAGYPQPDTLWPSVKWQQMHYQANPYIQIHDNPDVIFGRVTLSFPNKNDILETIEIDISNTPAGFAPGSAYLLKPVPGSPYDLILDIDQFPSFQPKARKVRLWKRI